MVLPPLLVDVEVVTCGVDDDDDGSLRLVGIRTVDVVAFGLVLDFVFAVRSCCSGRSCVVVVGEGGSKKPSSLDSVGDGGCSVMVVDVCVGVILYCTS